MKIKQLFVITFLSLFAVTGVNAQQPYGGCWHPDDIRNWTPETDPDAKFNRSRVPLAKRFKEPVTMKANDNQHYGGQICNSTILFPTCSASPSQGANNFLGYQPTYWQYMDKLVHWAGSASEGIIIPPPVGSTDAAHMSGVKSLGQIFFPPSSFGGQQAWVRQMLTQEGGKYVYAIKLYEIAKYMGFDGWFINEETGGGSTSEWVGFIQEFNRIADANGDTQMEIQWYNAAYSPNVTILKSHKNTSQFLEYGSPGDYRSYASQLGCTVDETFSKIYAGVQCVTMGSTGWGQYLNMAMPKTGHVGSLDLFCPEERIWKDNVKHLLGTKDDNGPAAYAAIEKTFKNEENMWVNSFGDPSQVVEGAAFPGLSGRMVERSAIQSMPFQTSFSVGVGKHRFVEGVKKGTQDWYHSGMQTVMPTWRWWIENKNDLKASIDWDDAYYLGSSVKIAGTLLQGDHLMRLYKTMIKIDNGGTLRLVYKTAKPDWLEVKLATESSVRGVMETLASPKTTTKNGWTIAEYDLSPLNGKTVYMIALNIKAKAEVPDYTLSLGELALLPANYAPEAVEVKNLATTSRLGEEKGDIRLTWDWDYTADLDHFDIYTETVGGVKTLVGQTRGEAFYIPTFARNENDSYVNVTVVPVMKDMKEHQGTTLKVEYPAPAAPTVTFKLSKSYIKVGETAVITAKGTGKPTAWKWTIPSSLSLVNGKLTDSQITVMALEPGKQMVTVQATNIAGTSNTTREVLDVMEDSEIGNVKNVVLHKKVVKYSGSTNSVEVPDRIIDGVTNPTATNQKWCNVATDNWVEFDCEGSYRIYGFRIYDGNSGPEHGVDQIRNYSIELSDDGHKWTKVVEEENAEHISIKTDYIAPLKARYVRLNAHVAGTLRIWEFEVYGKEDNNMTVDIEPAKLDINAGETKNITVKYALNGDERAPEFTCTATTATENVTIGDITEDKVKGEFTIPVTARKTIGADKITITVKNGVFYKERTVDVVVNSSEQPNILAGAEATVRHYESDYSFSAKYDEFATFELTDGDTAADACTMIEKPSTHKQDFWAIFTAPEKEWNLAKVKVYIPGNNQAENDNGKTGAANDEISIMAGNDLTNLTTIETFSNLNEVSELECILPEYMKCKYIAVVSTLNPYFYPTLAEVEAYEQYQESIPTDGPVEVSGWNYDVIAEDLPAMFHMSGPLDNKGWVLYSKSVQDAGAIAGDDRIVKTKSGVEFELADYAQPNALVFKRFFESHELKFAAPANCEELYFLALSANGASDFEAYANYTDGTKSETGIYKIEDWWGPTPSGDEAVYGISRIIITNADGYRQDEIDSRMLFRLYQLTLPTDMSKEVKSVTFTSKSATSFPTVLGVSKKGYMVPTGIEGVENGVTDREIVGIYTVNGVKTNSLQKGLNIIRFSDGSAKKVLIK